MTVSIFMSKTFSYQDLPERRGGQGSRGVGKTMWPFGASSDKVYVQALKLNDLWKRLNLSYYKLDFNQCNKLYSVEIGFVCHF